MDVPMTIEAAAVLERSMACLNSGVPNCLTGPSTSTFSERCVEVPWVAAHLQEPGRLLDIGWSMSPPEWLGVLLAAQDRGADLAGIDIVDPRRVASRYPAPWLERILAVPARVENFLEVEATSGVYDTITCVSTLEHIGFDIASPHEDSSTAFVRGRTPGEAISERHHETDGQFLDAVCRLLRPGGSLIITVPAGFGVPILHQDSLGLFTHQFEYDEASWNTLIHDSRFRVIDQAYYRHEGNAGWTAVPHFHDLTHQTSALKPFATACAMVHLIRR